MAKSGIKFTYLSGGPESITSITCISSSPTLKGTVILTPFVNLTSFRGGENGLEAIIGYSELTALSVFRIDGSNTLSFDISSLPVNLTQCVIQGSNTTTGNISSLPSGLTFYRNLGSNTTTGNIGNLPTGLITYHNVGLNTTSGNIGSLPATITRYQNQGNNTTTGNISSLPSNLVFYYNTGLNTVSSYYDGTILGFNKRVWANSFRYMLLQPSYSLMSDKHLATLIIDLSSTNWSNNPGFTDKQTFTANVNNPTLNLLDITYGIPLSAAIKELQNKGVTVTVNLTAF